MKMDNLTLVKEHAVVLKVKEALQSQFRVELRVDPVKPLSNAEREKYLTILFNEVLGALGIERFMELPIEVLEQFAVMSAKNNHDTKGLLVSLINSFITSYLTPETSDSAYECLTTLEQLKKDAADVHFELQKAHQNTQ